MTLLSHR